MEDVAGVYETAEIKKPSSSYKIYFSSTWVLDLAESGTFTLTENKFRKFIEDKKYKPQPLDGNQISGEWKLGRDSIICSWSGYIVGGVDISSAYEAGESLEGGSGEKVTYSLIFDVQATGDIISRIREVSRAVISNPFDAFDAYDPRFGTPADKIAKTRFKRVE